MNGPSNIIRLVSNDVVIYILLDKEIPLNKQSYCSNIRNIDINKYIVKKLDELYETHPTKYFTIHVTNHSTFNPISVNQYKGSYMNGMIKLCHNKFPNATCNYTTFGKKLYRDCEIIADNIEKKFMFIWTNRQFSLQDLIEIKDGLILLRLELEKIFNWFNGDSINPIFEKTIYEINEYIKINIDKINIDIDTFINTTSMLKSVLVGKGEGVDIINEKYMYPFDEMMKVYTMILKLNYFIEELGADIMAYINSIYLCGNIFGGKTKTLNNIIYVPELYGVNLIYVLVKFFKFKITNGFYIKDVEEDPANILKNTEIFIRQSPSFKDLKPIFLQGQSQNCINVDTFDELFL